MNRRSSPPRRRFGAAEPVHLRNRLSQINGYTLSATSSSASNSEKSGDDWTNDYTLDTSSTDTSSSTRTGTDGSGNAFSIAQSDNNSGTVHTTGDSSVGGYTATAIGTDTLSTDENISGGTNSSTLHQVVSGSSTLTNTGNDFSGVFATTNHEHNTTTLSQSGYNTSGTYTLAESMSDSPTIITSGNNIDGTQTYGQGGSQTYSLYQSNTSGADNYTLTGTGSKPYTITGTDVGNTGESDRTESGTDSYNLAQSGVASSSSFSLGLTGSDGYATTSSINSQTGAFSQTTTGSGSYTKTGTGAGGGATDFSSIETGSTRDGDVVLTASGVSRYDLLQGFNNTSDGGNGTAGIADFSPVGLPLMVGRASVPAGIFSNLGDARYQYCFAKGTLVLMADGSTKAIEKIEVGEMVLSVPDTNPEAKPDPCRVLEIYHNPPAKLLEVTVASSVDPLNGVVVRTTAEHPFYVRGKGWIKANDLKAGDRLRTDAVGKRYGVAVRLWELRPLANCDIECG